MQEKTKINKLMIKMITTTITITTIIKWLIKISNFVLIVCFYQDARDLAFKKIKQNLSIVWIKGF